MIPANGLVAPPDCRPNADAFGFDLHKIEPRQISCDAIVVEADDLDLLDPDGRPVVGRQEGMFDALTTKY
jgi:hypothetical protein